MRKKIVVADDEFHISRTLSLLFRREGFECRVASDGEKALQLVREHHPDILFLDLDMPKKNGYEVLREIRAERRFDDVAVVLLTAKGLHEDEELGYQLGADRYLMKPFDPTRVQQLVREFAR